MIFFWIATGLLTAAMLMAGVAKWRKPRNELEAMGMLWVEDYSEKQVTWLGIAETVGAIGLVVPMATGIAPILTPIAAACLAVLMAGAVFVHIRRKDPLPSMIITGLLTALAVTIACMGFSDVL